MNWFFRHSKSRNANTKCIIFLENHWYICIYYIIRQTRACPILLAEWTQQTQNMLKLRRTQKTKREEGIFNGVGCICLTYAEALTDVRDLEISIKTNFFLSIRMCMYVSCFLPSLIYPVSMVIEFRWSFAISIDRCWCWWCCRSFKSINQNQLVFLNKP